MIHIHTLNLRWNVAAITFDARYAKLRVCRATLANISDVRQAMAEHVQVHAAAATSSGAEALAAARAAPLKESRVAFTVRFASLHTETTRALDALATVHPGVRDVAVDLPTPTAAQTAEASAVMVPLDAVDDGVKLTGGRLGPIDLLRVGKVWLFCRWKFSCVY